MIDRQVEHMTRLIDDLLDVSRIARGKVTLHKEEINLTETGRTAVEDYRALLDGAGIVCQFKPPQSPIWIMGDAARLAQVIINLMDNARKFTDRGGCVTLEIGSTAKGEVAITVKDTGIGMDKETLARIFDPFSQADRSLDRSRGGLGLGLALVKGLVELHGGTVQANSAGLGHGSEFVVTLPGVIATRHQDRTRPLRTTSGRRRRILVVEDNVDAAESLRNLLELGGHVVEVAKSGIEALPLARTFVPDVVICDIGLPGGMNGYGVAKAMRADLNLRNAFIVAMTGYGQDEDRRSAMEAGFDIHLAKPADPKILEDILQQ
jgi:CheY-like chemotaxis protein